MHLPEIPQMKDRDIYGMIIAVAITACGWGITYNTMKNADETSTKDIAMLTKHIESVQGQLQNFVSIQQQIASIAEKTAENEASLSEANNRIDKVVEVFGDKLDTISDNLNKIVTRVEVMTAQVNGYTASDVPLPIQNSRKGQIRAIR